MNREDYLQKKITPYDPSKVDTVEQALMMLQSCSFQGRNLGMSLEVLTNMVKDSDCLRVLTLSGAMIPAGMEEIIIQGIEKKIILAIVTTGANIIHSLANGFANSQNQAHYIGSDHVDDATLYELRINRVYDTYIPEDEYINTEHQIKSIIEKDHEPGKQYIYTPSKFIKYLGSKIPGRSFVKTAAEHDVPIFCGASSDSELGLDLLVFRHESNYQIILDELGDVTNFGELIKNYSTHGTIIIGGGVPRNWAQQIFPYLDQINKGSGREYGGYTYSIRFHSAVQHDGGLSGCTISESISWGKYGKNATHQSVWGDATVYFPLVMTALFQRIKRLDLSI